MGHIQTRNKPKREHFLLIGKNHLKFVQTTLQF